MNRLDSKLLSKFDVFNPKTSLAATTGIGVTIDRYDEMRIPGSEMDAASGLLRLFLEKGGVVTPAASSRLE